VEANFYSMAMLADVQGTSMLLCGDLDGVYEMYAAEKADVLKAAHHGSADSTGQQFLAKVAPQVVLVSTSGAGQLQRMQERAADAQVYSTRQHGALTIRFEPGTYTITTFK
jgi:competence protein ComEC